MKKIQTTLFKLMAFAALLLTWTACGDVEHEGTPQPRNPEITVEAEEYYVQIATENVDGYAFIYRWLDLDGVTWHITVSNVSPDEADPDNTGAVSEGIEITDQSILTYNGVRELQINNRDILNYLQELGLFQADSKSTLYLYLAGTNADGTSVLTADGLPSYCSTIHVTVGPGVE